MPTLAIINQLLGITPRASEHAALIDNMMEFVHWFMALLFVGWTTYFIYTIIRFHKSRHPKADYHGVRSHASTHIEFSVVLIEAVILLGFALPLWGVRVNEIPKDTSKALVIRVVGQQYFWNFQYPGKDGVFGQSHTNLMSSSNLLGIDRNEPAAKDDIIAKDEFHVPVGRPVVLELSSKDVIHNVSLESMRIGQDCIPGLQIPVWFTPTKTGTYELICAQLCGANHYAMKGTLVVDTEKDYEDWIDGLAQLQIKK